MNKKIDSKIINIFIFINIKYSTPTIMQSPPVFTGYFFSAVRPFGETVYTPIYFDMLVDLFGCCNACYFVFDGFSSFPLSLEEFFEIKQAQDYEHLQNEADRIAEREHEEATLRVAAALAEQKALRAAALAEEEAYHAATLAAAARDAEALRVKNEEIRHWRSRALHLQGGLTEPSAPVRYLHRDTYATIASASIDRKGFVRGWRLVESNGDDFSNKNAIREAARRLTVGKEVTADIYVLMWRDDISLVIQGKTGAQFHGITIPEEHKFHLATLRIIGGVIQPFQFIPI